jgi:N-acyl-D-aspartate/D-glutamate deacylase
MKALLLPLCFLSLAVGLGLACGGKQPEEQPIEADFLVCNAVIHDGTGNPGRKGNLAIKGDRIAAVGSFCVAGKPKVLDGTGLIIVPGFIDLHTHCDLDPGITKPDRHGNLNYLYQGVTTVVTGNCGKGPVDVADFLQKVEDNEVGTNVLHLIPHNDLRRQVMKGNAKRPPTPEELAEMKRLVDKGMRDGAWGLSTGLFYVPGAYADIHEVIELAKVAARHGGLYASHIRNEEEGLLEYIEEALKIGERAGIPVHISHLKRGNAKLGGATVVDVLNRIEGARKAGGKVTADQYPYTAWSTKMSDALIPPRFLEGKPEEIADRLDENRLTVLAAVKKFIDLWDSKKTLQIARYDKRPKWQGKMLGEIAEAEKRPAEEIVFEVVRNGDAYVVGFSMSEEDVRRVMDKPYVATASDGHTELISENTVPHPRSYGTFPRKIGEYARDKKVVTLEQSLRSCTGLPADILRLPERGYLKPGYFADVAVIDLTAFREKSTYDKPHQYAEGVRHLFVNGVPIISAGQYTSALAGRPIRHQSPAAALEPPTPK